MEGSYFYFLAWFSWITVTFFMRKTKIRSVSALAILFMIIISQQTISLGAYHISVAMLCMLMMGIVGLSKYSLWNKLYSIICSTIIGMIYAVTCLLELYDPILIVVNRLLMISVLIVCVAVLLMSIQTQRLFVICLGIVQGEILLTIILQPYGFYEEMGSMLFLDTAACTIFLLYAVAGIRNRIAFVEPFKQKTSKGATRLDYE